MSRLDVVACMLLVNGSIIMVDSRSVFRLAVMLLVDSITRMRWTVKVWPVCVMELLA